MLMLGLTTVLCMEHLKLHVLPGACWAMIMSGTVLLTMHCNRGMGNQLRQLFVTMIIFCGVLDENGFFFKVLDLFG